MEIGQDIQLNLTNEKNQNEFLNSTLWKTINNGIDIGIRYLLPDLIEEEIIELKDNLINFGLKDGIKKSKLRHSYPLLRFFLFIFLLTFPTLLQILASHLCFSLYPVPYRLLHN